MPTPVLRSLQADVWQALARTPGTSSAPASLLQLIEPGPQLDASARLQVYVDAYFWRLHQVLRENFPRLASRLTEEEFQKLIADYLRQHPSRHPSISYAGAQLADFLEQSNLPPYLAALARLEWTQALVFECADTMALSADALREVAPERWADLRFRPIPGLTVLRLRHPVHLLWRDADAVVNVEEPASLRVWRTADYRVIHSVLDARENRALEALCRGETFARICEAFSDLEEQKAAQESINLLVRWLEDGILQASDLS